MKIAVVPNLMKEDAVACTDEIVDILQRYGCETVLKTDLFTPNGIYCQCRDDSLASCDVFIAVGGDGTIIHTAKLAASFDRPILGVNAGTMGFTAGVERHELFLLPNLLSGQFREESRLMVSVRLESDGRSSSYLALNDAVLSGEVASIIDYQMALGENQGYRCRADGFIVATPTGSTAYSLSAGGPVIQPDMDCLVYTPVCSHGMFSKSVVFGGDTELRVTVPENTKRVFLTVDGEAPVEILPGDSLFFSRAKRRARFLMLDKRNFYDILNQKIIAIR